MDEYINNMISFYEIFCNMSFNILSGEWFNKKEK